jgi:hypothetical protein
MPPKAAKNKNKKEGQKDELSDNPDNPDILGSQLSGSQLNESQLLDSTNAGSLPSGNNDFTSNLVAALQTSEVKNLFIQIQASSLKTQEVRNSYIDILRPAITEEVQNAVQPLADRILAQEMNADMVQTQTANKIDELRTKNDQLVNKIRQLDKASRLCNLKLVGLKFDLDQYAKSLASASVDTNDDQEDISVENAKPDESTHVPPLSIQKVLKTKVISVLKDAGFRNISLNDIARITRIRVPGKENILLLDMQDEETKITFLKQKKLLKNISSNLFLNEDLSPETSQLFKKCRELVKKGNLHATWIRSCEVMAKTDDQGKPFRVKLDTFNEINV